VDVGKRRVAVAKCSIVAPLLSVAARRLEAAARPVSDEVAMFVVATASRTGPVSPLTVTVASLAPEIA
jgi:hypothetical protein